MQGRTIQGLNGGYIARIYRPVEKLHEMRPHPRAVRLGNQWEIEGYGETPEAAEADLQRRFRGNIR